MNNNEIKSKEIQDAVFGESGRHLKRFRTPNLMFWVMLLSVAITVALFLMVTPEEKKDTPAQLLGLDEAPMMETLHIPGLRKPSVVDLRKRELYVFRAKATNVYSLDDFKLKRILPKIEKKDTTANTTANTTAEEKI